jgi:putative aldouronate transport system substrate-binding protein
MKNIHQKFRRVFMIKKTSYLVLALVLVVSVFAGCGGGASSAASTASSAASTASSAAPAASSAAPAADSATSEHADVIMWMTGATQPRDIDMVVSQLNDKFEADLNCSFTFNVFNDPNTAQKMTTLLSSGEQIDLIYAAGWTNYPNFVNMNAYLPLDDIVPTASPNLWNYVTERMWNDVKVNGQIYMVPCMWEEWNVYGFGWREDLRVKHNLVEPTSLETIEQMCEGLIAAEPDIPLSLESPLNNVKGPYFSSWEILDMKYQWANWRVPYGLYIPYENPKDVTYHWESQNFRDDMKMFKRWADKGFWSRSALATTETASDHMKAGSIMVDFAFNSVGGYAQQKADMSAANPDWNFEWLPFGPSTKNMVLLNHATQNGFVVPITSGNPERAIMVLEKLTLDKEYHLLSQYGIEGTHYNVDANGYYETIGDQVSSGFPREALRLWATRNEEFMLYTPTTGPLTKEINAQLREKSQPDIWSGFTVDETEYLAEKAAVTDVQTQYVVPIEAGLVEDVDAAIDEMLAMMETAGIRKIHESYIAQWQAYVDEMGIPNVDIPDVK